MSIDDPKMVRFTLPAGGYCPTPEDTERLKRLAEMPDEDIDFSDIPPITDEQWATRLPGSYRVSKQSVTLRLDSGVVDWFAANADESSSESEINRVLRQHVARQLLQDRKKRA